MRIYTENSLYAEDAVTVHITGESAHENTLLSLISKGMIIGHHHSTDITQKETAPTTLLSSLASTVLSIEFKLHK